MQLPQVRVGIVFLVMALAAIACELGGATISFSQATPTASPTPTPTIDHTATAQAQANVTATAQAQANATATAQANATATALANATATAQANTTATAQAQATVTAQARDTALAQTQATASARAQATAAVFARATATTQAAISRATNLVQSAKKSYSLAEGVIDGVPAPYVSAFVPKVSAQNFVAEVRFFNPADRAVHPWDYGISFRYAAGDTRNQCSLILTSSGIWAVVIPTKSLADHVEVKVVGSGQLTKFDSSPTGSNSVRLVVHDKDAFVFVNDTYVATVDVSETFSTDIWLGSAFSQGDNFPGLHVRFTDFNIYTLP